MLTDDQTLLRYSRQIMLPEVDIAGQERLAAARVLIVGLGGLGSPAAMYLAAAGVGTLLLNDDDAVELSNLQRQIVHDSSDVGHPKVASAAAKLQALNPLAKIETLARRLTGDELAALLPDVDVVLDCSDNLATRLALNAASVAARRPLVSGAAIRFEGQVLVTRPDFPDAPCYRCLYRSDQDVADRCADAGVVAPLLGIVGSIQALEAMKVIIGAGATLTGRLLLVDALRMDWQTIKVPKNPSCPVCAR